MMKDQELIDRLEKLVQTERKITSDILECLRHVEARRLYLNMGYTSMFAYLTEKLGYTAACAQRRIDASRMLTQVPELKEELKQGSLNLSQVALVAKGIREVLKSSPEVEFAKEDKLKLLEQVKNKTLDQTEQTLSRALGIKFKEQEKVRPRENESVRLEITLTR